MARRPRNLYKQYIKIVLKHAKKESTPYARVIVRFLRAQIQRKRGVKSKRGQPPYGRTGKFKKLIQARKKFQGSGRLNQGRIPFLKIGHWSPVSNVLFSPKSKRYRPLVFPTGTGDMIKTATAQAVMNDPKATEIIQKQIDYEFQRKIKTAIGVYKIVKIVFKL